MLSTFLNVCSDGLKNSHIELLNTLLLLIFVGLNFRDFRDFRDDRKITKLRSSEKKLLRRLTTPNVTSYYKTLSEFQLLLQSMPVISEIKICGADPHSTCLFLRLMVWKILAKFSSF